MITMKSFGFGILVVDGVWNTEKEISVVIKEKETNGVSIQPLVY
jgi:hypothetical protein